MNSPSAEDELQRRVEQYLGQPVEPGTWRYLKEQGKVDQVLREEKDLNWLSTEIGKFREAAGQRGTAPAATRFLTPDQRARARGRDQVLSILFAQEAEKLDGVKEFREQVLGGHLLTLGEIDGWLVRQRGVDGPQTEWLTQVPVPDGYTVEHVPGTGGYVTEPPLTISKTTAALGVRVEKLAYWTPRCVGAVYTSARGVLERLRRLAVELQEMFGWEEAQATTFALAGEVPHVLPMRVLGPERYVSGRLEIPLVLDLALTPRQAADYYRVLRKAFVTLRIRTLSGKHMRLAAFAAQQPSKASWPDRLHAWNLAHPDSKYRCGKYFKRDCLMARQRLLASALPFGPEAEAERERRQASPPPLSAEAAEVIRQELERIGKDLERKRPRARKARGRTRTLQKPPAGRRRSRQSRKR
jgi:hypothetical protein